MRGNSLKRRKRERNTHTRARARAHAHTQGKCIHTRHTHINTHTHTHIHTCADTEPSIFEHNTQSLGLWNIVHTSVCHLALHHVQYTQTHKTTKHGLVCDRTRVRFKGNHSKPMSRRRKKKLGSAGFETKLKNRKLVKWEHTWLHKLRSAEVTATDFRWAVSNRMQEHWNVKLTVTTTTTLDPGVKSVLNVPSH